jgi:urease accessory protein UreH
MIGPGKYDDLVTQLREGLQAKAILLVVIQGNKGNGVSQQIAAGTKEEAQKILGDIAHGLRPEVQSMLEPKNKA